MKHTPDLILACADERRSIHNPSVMCTMHVAMSITARCKWSRRAHLSLAPSPCDIGCCLTSPFFMSQTSDVCDPETKIPFPPEEQLDGAKRRAVAPLFSQSDSSKHSDACAPARLPHPLPFCLIFCVPVGSEHIAPSGNNNCARELRGFRVHPAGGLRWRIDNWRGLLRPELQRHLCTGTNRLGFYLLVYMLCNVLQCTNFR